MKPEDVVLLDVEGERMVVEKVSEDPLKIIAEINKNSGGNPRSCCGATSFTRKCLVKNMVYLDANVFVLALLVKDERGTAANHILANLEKIDAKTCCLTFDEVAWAF